MRRISLLLLIVILFPCIMTGCTTDSREIDDQVYIVVMGADIGVDNKIRLTIQFPTYKDSGGGGGMSGMKKSGGGEESEESGVVGSSIVQTIEAPSILEGLNLLNTATTRRISLVHIKEIIFSEEFARQGVKSYLEPLARFRETRRIMQISVCKGSAEDYIKENKTLIETSVAKAMELANNQSLNTGIFPRTPFQEFYKDLLSPYGQSVTGYTGINDFKKLKPLSQVLPPLKTQYELLPGEIPRKGGAKSENIGTAVFNGDRMVGSLGAYETRYYLMVTGQFKRGIFTFEDKKAPGNVIPFDLRPGRKPKIKLTFENDVPLISVKLNIEADIGAIQSRIPYEKVEKIDELNNMLEETIKDGVKKVIEKTQKEWNTDIFKFGYYAAAHFFTIQEFEKYNWLRHYKEARVNVDVEANVRRTGIMAESVPVRYNDEDILSEEK